MHNNIMAAGLRDRPPMLALGRYAQWQSRFLRYIDTRPNGDALRKCILEGPYTHSTVTILAIPATYDTLVVPERTVVKTILNMSPENKAHYESEKEAIHLLLTGIGNEIYSTVDACKIAHEMWIAIERYREYDLAHLKLVFEFSIYNVWKLVQYGVSNGLDTAYWGFLGVGTTFDIFQNIILIPYLEYGVLSPLDTAY
ncbi:hypothetical protein Tco_0393781 [Tanacetum coccineum]